MDNSDKKICFVVQGFGTKTDFTVKNRVLNLDASYAVIKEAVEDAGLVCIRADEIQHSGTIDQPMYEQLLRADLVIADLSTYNVNAAFELGVRYGLRPQATIVVAENQFKNPFDVGHIVIRSYEHLGKDVGASEARRFRRELRAAIEEIMEKQKPDSPVYTFLPQLQPPKETGTGPAQSEPAPPPGAANASAGSPAGGGEESAKTRLDSALEKMAKDDFVGARSDLEEVKKLRPNDPYVTQQLALAIYKSKQPDAKTALNDACTVLHELRPGTSNDPETLGIWGAVHKRLWDLTGEQGFLAKSITAYERGFVLNQDYYNGINLAYLLNQRALEFLKAGKRDEAISDTVGAKRVRDAVIQIAAPLAENPAGPPESDYWVAATLWEAAVGLADEEAIAKWEKKAREIKVAGWMVETTESQIKKLKALLQDYADLMNA